MATQATTKKPAARKAAPKKPVANKTAAKKPTVSKATAVKPAAAKKSAAARKPATAKKPVAAKKATTAKKPVAAKVSTTATQTRKSVADHIARKTVSSKNRVTSAVKKTTVLGVEVPSIDLRKFDLPNTDELRAEVVEHLETAQDAVVSAPERLQDFANELHELYLDRFSDAIDKVRELVNR